MIITKIHNLYLTIFFVYIFTSIKKLKIYRIKFIIGVYYLNYLLISVLFNILLRVYYVSLYHYLDTNIINNCF